MTPEQREKHLKTIEKIEGMQRPKKWREIKKLLLEINPSLIPLEKNHSEACKELREASDKFGASKTKELRNTMKLFAPVYNALCAFDQDLLSEMSGKNRELNEKIGKDLWRAFPEYRIAREW